MSLSDAAAAAAAGINPNYLQASTRSQVEPDQLQVLKGQQGSRL